jgi:hypothetical protein
MFDGLTSFKLISPWLNGAHTGSTIESGGTGGPDPGTAPICSG